MRVFWSGGVFPKIRLLVAENPPSIKAVRLPDLNRGYGFLNFGALLVTPEAAWI